MRSQRYTDPQKAVGGAPDTVCTHHSRCCWPQPIRAIAGFAMTMQGRSAQVWNAGIDLSGNFCPELSYRYNKEKPDTGPGIVESRFTLEAGASKKHF